MTSTIASLFESHDAERPAIGAPGRPWLTYGGLRVLSSQVKTSLNEAGIGRGDRVAIVLPNGPEMAAAFITIAQTAITAPLNPGYRQQEYAFYLEDLNAKALVVAQDDDGPAVQAALEEGMSIVRLSFDAADPAGTFSLSAEKGASKADTSAPQADDVALVLHTSGTTSRPKIVPLLQSNVATSASNVKAALALTHDDRCLNVMPLFHIHGLIAALGGTLAAGGQISCASGFNALKFFAQMDEVKPTWYTAVPTMHQAILTRSERNLDVISRVPLRFLRSSSASLPAPVMAELERVFKAPVVEAYGMTEAAHQMCCNPLALNSQKPGSVGIAAGPMVRIADEAESRLLPSGVIGEVVISGPNVTLGYEGNPAANESAFFEAEGARWFRTGDQGAFDENGFLDLTGRLKEIINRGGEKISPLEVDSILLEHPAVGMVVTFGLPHPKLGEEVAVAVVLAEGQSATEQEIRAFASQSLADFKVPRKVIFLDEIPKGATGKMQRIGLAQKLGLAE